MGWGQIGVSWGEHWRAGTDEELITKSEADRKRRERERRERGVMMEGKRRKRE